MVNLKLTSDGEHLTMTEEMGIWPPGDIWPSLVFLSHQTSLSQSALPTPSALICLTRGMKLLLRQASHNQTQLITVSCTPRSHSHYTQHSWCYRKKDIHSALLWSQQAVHAALTLSVLRRQYDVQGNPTDLFNIWWETRDVSQLIQNGKRWEMSGWKGDISERLIHQDAPVCIQPLSCGLTLEAEWIIPLWGQDSEAEHTGWFLRAFSLSGFPSISVVTIKFTFGAPDHRYGAKIVKTYSKNSEGEGSN